MRQAVIDFRRRGESSALQTGEIYTEVVRCLQALSIMLSDLQVVVRIKAEESQILVTDN